MFGGFYWAQVPAGIASVRVTVNLPAAGPITANVGNQYSDHTVKVTFANPVTADVSFPPAWTPAGRQFSIAPRPPASHHANGGGFPWVVLIIPLLVAALVGVFLFSRRRRDWVSARELVWPPRALPPATTALLMRVPPLALPVGAGQPAKSPSTASDGTPEETTPLLTVRLLDGLYVEGLRRPIRRSSVRRLLVCLAMSPERPLSAEELAVAISDHPDRDPNVNSVQSYASILRGSLPEGLLPDADVLDGYRLDPDRVVVDWVTLNTVTNESADAPGWAERATAALELVRDKPLAGRAWEGIESMVRVMNARIDELGRTLAQHLIATGDPAGAERAVARAMIAVPKSVGLWEDRLSAAAAGSGYGLERAWTDVQSELGPDAALLASHYQRLRRSLGEPPGETA